ncbi:MAG TPA: hypothetical protein VLD65_09460, partial [Anaerolineales bacterium]|nr:hypothetical protein [Anaerolineales bacterium]
MKTRILSISILVLLTIVIFLLTSQTALAATCTWTGGSGNWNEPAHWSCGYVPDEGDDAVISNGSTVTVTADDDVGSLILSSGLVSMNAGTTLSASTYTMSGGTLTGAGTLTAGTINWSDGTMAGSGVTTATSEVNFTGSSQIYLYDRTFNNAGAATWDRTASMYFNPAGTTFNNQASATFTVVNTGGTVVYGQGTFNNAGTLTKSSVGSTNISLIFNHSGTVNVESGTLDITNNVASSSTGIYHIPAGARLKLTGTHNLSGSLPFTGNGTIEIAGHVNVSGAGAYVYSGTTLIPNGTLSLSTELTTASTEILDLTGGTVTGSGDLSAHTINWSDGTMSGSGVTTATSEVNFTGSSQIYLYDRTFNNAGAATWDRTASM